MCNFYSAPTVTNCILWGDEDEIGGLQEGPAVVTWLRANASFRHLAKAIPRRSDIEESGGSANWNVNMGKDGGGNIDLPPAFENDTTPKGLKDGTWLTWDDGLYIKPGSPCIDEADGDFAPQRDIRGRERFDVPPTGGGAGVPDYVDIGAYERRPLVFVMCWIDESDEAYFSRTFNQVMWDRFHNDLEYYNKLACSETLRGVSGGCWVPIPTGERDCYGTIADVLPCGYLSNPSNPPPVVMVGEILLKEFDRDPYDIITVNDFTTEFERIQYEAYPDNIVLIVDTSGSMNLSTINPAPGYPYWDYTDPTRGFTGWLAQNYGAAQVVRIDGTEGRPQFQEENWIEAMNTQVQGILDGL